MQQIFDVFQDGLDHILLWLIPFALLIIALNLLSTPRPRKRDGETPGPRIKTWIGWGLLTIAMALSALLWAVRGGPLELPHLPDVSNTLPDAGLPDTKQLVTATDEPAPPRQSNSRPRQPDPVPPRQLAPTSTPRSGAASLSWAKDEPATTPTSGVPPDCALARAQLLIKDTDENRYQRDLACR